jgi:hypothetical protein
MSLASDLETWAVAQGVKIDGVGIQEFPGRGFGLFATRDLQVGCFLSLWCFQRYAFVTSKAALWGIEMSFGVGQSFMLMC